MIKAVCDFCGKKTIVFRTHYGSGFGYVRLICASCVEVLNADIIQKKNKSVDK